MHAPRLALATLLAAVAATVPVAGATGAADQGAKRSYIVTVGDGANARGIARAVQANPNFVYDSLIDGFAAKLNAGQLRALQNNPAVTTVERDAIAGVVGKSLKRTGKPVKDDTNTGNGGGSRKVKRRASFSNYGSYVDTYAPGVGILSASMSGGTTSMSGTSMAAPHVAGVAALYKAAHGDAASSTVHGWVAAKATPGVVAGNPSGTVNRLLHMGPL